MKYKCLILEDRFKDINDKLKKNLPLLLDNANVFILRKIKLLAGC